MALTTKNFGTTTAGEEVTLFELTGESGVKAQLLDYGALLHSVSMPDRDGKADEITLGFTSLSSYEENPPYFGATVGRFGNRIAKGEFELDGKAYSLARNDGENHLHGGVEGFHKRLWSAEASEGASGSNVTFRLVSPDGDESYPGTLNVRVTYSLDDAGRLSIDYEATTDHATPINLTNHAYWNLAGAGSGNVGAQVLSLAADRYLEVDDALIPTGKIADVVGTPFDFATAPTAIGARMDEVGGYDLCYVLADAPRQQPVLAASVTDPVSGRGLRILTTEPGIQLYTAIHLPSVDVIGEGPFAKYGAFCLEAQHFPDSPNQPSFPSTTLRPGETYRQTTVHELFVH
jgi:aldose 1-epimerase